MVRKILYLLIYTVVIVSCCNFYYSRKIDLVTENLVSKCNNIIEGYVHDNKIWKAKYNNLKTRLIELQENYTTDKLLRCDMIEYISSKYTYIESETVTEIVDSIIENSRQYNFSPELILGIIETESNFNNKAISSKGARGLMQVMPMWVGKFGVTQSTDDLFDVKKNIFVGTNVLQVHYDEAHGDLYYALQKYSFSANAYQLKIYKNMAEFSIFRDNQHTERMINAYNLE